MRGLRQPMEGIRMLGGLAAGAVVLAIVYLFANEYLVMAKNEAPGGYGDHAANAWINTGLDVVLPGAFLALAFFGFVSYSVFQWGITR